ncbi:hypothetical protein PORY_002244 [Pneumocystis oryctolagi]|uniref:Uncharacterized protein n=1 Tax=Pneumocystis oryctolagi TaxID=42067 RepID=A0ACB7C996_9ASCO|nr:hypothetical protein PORY_002244 [Pneumocystis oryctolagi]
MKRIVVCSSWIASSVFHRTKNSSCAFKRMLSRMRAGIKRISLDILEHKRVLPSLCKVRFLILFTEYFLFSAIYVFCLSILPYTGFIKLFIVLLMILLLAFPVTRSFFHPSLPIASWLILFYACRFIPLSIRPRIWVTVLPTLENIVYGSSLSSLLSKHTYFFLDILAWIPYGIIHFGAPFLTSIIIYLFSPPGTLPIFAKSFGYLNLIGVIIQLMFPCSPPWYENVYGNQPANYTMEGSAGGLARIDGFFGMKLYTSTFPASPLVFGAFPSLHAGHAMLEALFLTYVFPKTTPYFVLYVLWLWWCTMYLTHHYFVDLIGGSCLAAFIFYIARHNYLPHIQPGNLFRWDYYYTLFNLSEMENHELSISRNSFDQYKPIQDNAPNKNFHNDHIFSSDSFFTYSCTNKLLNKSYSMSTIWDEEIVDYINTPSSIYDTETMEGIDIVIK